MTATFHASANGGNFGSATLSITCTISTGDSIVVFGGWDPAAGTPTVATNGGTGSDSLSLVYAGSTVNPGGDFKYGAWLLQSAGAGRTGVTITWTGGNPGYTSFFCESFSGLSSVALDKTADPVANANTGNTPTLSSADEFAIAFGMSSGGISAVNSPWTSDGIEPNNGCGGGHQVLSATTPIASNFTNGSGVWSAFVLTFQAGGAPPAKVPYNPWPQAAPILAQ